MQKLTLAAKLAVLLWAGFLQTSGTAAFGLGGLSDGGGATMVFDACAVLSGATFVSVSEYEMGNSPNGPGLGHWQVSFSPAAFHYDLSDFSLGGAYECTSQEGRVTAKDGDFKFDGNFDPGTGLLVWDHKWFQIQPRH